MDLVSKVSMAAIFDFKLAAISIPYILLNISRTKADRKLNLVVELPLSGSLNHMDIVCKAKVAAILDSKMAAIENIFSFDISKLKHLDKFISAVI